MFLPGNEFDRLRNTKERNNLVSLGVLFHFWFLLFILSVPVPAQGAIKIVME